MAEHHEDRERPVKPVMRPVEELEEAAGLHEQRVLPDDERDPGPVAVGVPPLDHHPLPVINRRSDAGAAQSDERRRMEAYDEERRQP